MNRLCLQHCGRQACQGSDGYKHNNCCKECKFSSGREHSDRCGRRQASTLYTTLPVGTSHQAFGLHIQPTIQAPQADNRNWPTRHTPISSSTSDVHVPQAKSYYILSLGLDKGQGKDFLDRNSTYGPYVFDVRAMLSRESDNIGGPYGTDAATKARIGELDGFREALNTATVTVLTHQFVILACRSGHHRSVAIAEILYDRLTHPIVKEMQVHFFHYELASATARGNYEKSLEDFFVHRTTK